MVDSINSTIDDRAEGSYPADDQAMFMPDADALGTVSVNGTVYKIEDYGYVCGKEFAIMLLSGDSAVVSPAPYCNICASCLHPEGESIRPDYVECGTPIGDYGIFVKFNPAWKSHCLGVLGYSSVSAKEPN